MSSIRNWTVTQPWTFFTFTEKEASPMAEILPETEARSAASLNRRLCGWEASASGEIATLKHATNAVTMNRATRVMIVQNRIIISSRSLSGCLQVKDGTERSKMLVLCVFVSE